MINPIDINSTMFNIQGKNLEKLQETSKLTPEQDNKLKKAASDFEAVFLNKFLEIMDSTVEKSEFMHGGQAEKTFKSMLNQEIAKGISSNPSTSFGFAEQIYKQMKENIINSSTVSKEA